MAEMYNIYLQYKQQNYNISLIRHYRWNFFNTTACFVWTVLVWP